jgi:hypothetical protein
MPTSCQCYAICLYHGEKRFLYYNHPCDAVLGVFPALFHEMVAAFLQASRWERRARLGIGDGMISNFKIHKCKNSGENYDIVYSIMADVYMPKRQAG